MSIRIGVLGAGRIGKIHSATLLAMGSNVVQLHAVCDPFLDEKWAASLNITHVLTNEDEFFDCDLDAIVVASPTSQHAEHILRAIDKGIHVLCEKPVDFSLAAHRDIAEKLKSTASKLQIGFNRRFCLDFEKIASLNRGRSLGNPYLLRITSRDPGLPSQEYLRSSGGMFVDMTIHDFDMARFVMNSEVTEVFAYGAALVDKRIEEIGDIDTAVITLKFANGAFGVIDNSRQAIYGYDQRLELFGSAGALANENHRATSVQHVDKSGRHQEPILNFFLERYALSYRRELEAFVASIVTGTACSPTIKDAEMAVRLALAAQESLRAHKPVRVEEIV